MEISKCYRCGGSEFELSATTPPIFVRPKETNFLTLKRGAQMAAKVCRACGAVTMTVDKNEMAKLQKKPRGSQLFMIIFVITVSTLLDYLNHIVNEMEKGFVEQHQQLEVKDTEIKKLTKNIDSLATKQGILLDYIVAAVEDKKGSEINWQSIKADTIKQPAGERKQYIIASVEKLKGIKP